jgi:hypothetical protein
MLSDSKPKISELCLALTLFKISMHKEHVSMVEGILRARIVGVLNGNQEEQTENPEQIEANGCEMRPRSDR